MSTVRLRPRFSPQFRVDLRDVRARSPGPGAGNELQRWKVWHGNDAVELGELFDVDRISNPDDAVELRFEGDLRRFDRIGWRHSAGRIVIDGSAGDYVGARMSGGEIIVAQHAGLFAGCAMGGGSLQVRGDVGDFAATAFPGDMHGMHGGTMRVEGNAGRRFGDRMRRGTAVVHGCVGAFAGSRMIAGTIAVGGDAGAHPAFGMRRGTIIFASAKIAPPRTFVEPEADIGVLWQLLARSFQRFGGPFGDLAARMPKRFVGDLATNGKGELLFAS